MTSTQLNCTPKQKIITNSQLPERMSGAYRRIKEIETPKPPAPERPDVVHGPPRFVTQLQVRFIAHLSAMIKIGLLILHLTLKFLYCVFIQILCCCIIMGSKIAYYTYHNSWLFWLFQTVSFNFRALATLLVIYMRIFECTAVVKS